MLPVLLLLGLAAAQSPAERQLQAARQLRAESRPGPALLAAERALERDPRHLEALGLFAELSLQLGDTDAAVHAWHAWLDQYDAHKVPPLPAKAREAVLAHLRAHDRETRSWNTLQADYVRELTTLAKDYRARKDLLAAIECLQQILEVEPHHEAAAQAIAEIRRTGGREVAVEDAFAGSDPSLGLSAEQIAALDAQHRDWDKSWTKETDNYRYRTNAGLLVLETAAIAMEQMNRFYRRFFRWKEDGGKTPRIEIRIFRTRDEYLKLGQSPVAWSGGHFTGDAVETFCGGVAGKSSALDMYRTLFHEAAHQFVSLTGPFVPGWLNEAYASFFEGCVILSNGSVKWNLPPAERLFSLAARLEKGWMSGPDDGVKDAAGEWAAPERAPRLRTIVAGGYAWGPPWYAPTWGVVYYLYNARTGDGRLIYREALHRYYESFKRGAATDPVAHFEEIVLAGSPLAGTKSIDALDEDWRRFILGLRDRETGKASAADEWIGWADQALARGDKAAALELYEAAREMRPEDVALLEKTARLLEESKLLARAADLWRELARTLEVREEASGERYELACKKVLALDPLARARARLRQTLAERGLALARSYESRSLPTMALEIARRMSASFSVQEALAYYAQVAERNRKSLARWRVAYDESSLAGWAGGEDSYQPYGVLLRADVPAADEPGGMRTRELCCDVTFDGDFSLEAEMQLDGGALCGLCFGRKDANNLHAVLLHEKGFLDVVTKRGPDAYETRDHRQVAVGREWHKLRIDVTGRAVDVYLDGFYLRSLEFGSEQTLRGAFGLVTGPGKAQYRNIRLLARERYDPAARLERRLAMQRLAQGEILRQPGTFSGEAPPPLAVAEWVQGGPLGLADLVGRPVLLALWSPAQDRVIPTAAYYAHLARTGAERGLQVVVVCDSGTTRAELTSHLAAHPMPAVALGLDRGNTTFTSYWVKQGGFGMPRVLLIDRGGKVVFEGDPGLKSGVGWRPEDGDTYVDAPLRALLGR